MVNHTRGLKPVRRATRTGEGEARRASAIKSPVDEATPGSGQARPVGAKIRARSARPAPPRDARTRDPQNTSAAILAAAVKEFSEKGYGGARINTIAARANINKRMLYHYFGGKDALYLAVLEGAYVSIRSAENRLHLRDLDPVEGMRELIVFTWRYVLEHPEFPSLLSTENLHRAKYLKRSARIFDLHSPLIAELTSLLRRGEEAGQFRSNVDPVKLYISIASLAFFYLSNRWTLSTIFRRDFATESELATWEPHIVDVILSYLKPAA
jgi:AcrR family transcriptional regulator